MLFAFCCVYLLFLAPSDPPTNVTAEMIGNEPNYIRVTWTVRVIKFVTNLECRINYKLQIKFYHFEDIGNIIGICHQQGFINSPILSKFLQATLF